MKNISILENIVINFAAFSPTYYISINNDNLLHNNQNNKYLDKKFLLLAIGTSNKIIIYKLKMKENYIPELEKQIEFIELKNDVT